MCNRMMRFDVPLIDQAMHPYFRDIQDHVIRLVESIDDLRDLLAAALEAHLLLSSVEQNKIIKIFSVAAVVLMPPTLIASIYGMNFKNRKVAAESGYLTPILINTCGRPRRGLIGALQETQCSACSANCLH
jgi:Mg2+ and Co2+ transporter CorA